MAHSIVLICTDGSDLADEAAAAGMALLQPADETVVVTVVEPVDVSVGAHVSGFAGSGLSADQIEIGRQELLTEAERLVERTAQRLGLAGVTAKVLEGEPGAVLCNFAAETGASAIVMGSRGRSGLKRAILGSVSDHVVRNAPCPVVITNAAGQD
jgi:nucleotide-binding universal stress UspA family protein